MKSGNFGVAPAGQYWGGQICTANAPVGNIETSWS